MLTYIVYSTASILAFLVLAKLFVAAVDGSVPAAVGAFVIVVLALAAVIQGAANENKERPCAEYEIRMMCNAATKTVMPMRVCVLHGEWIEE